MEERDRKLFLWGLLLAWVPWVPGFIGLLDAFKGVSEQKATGHGAVVATLEFFAIFGLVVAFVFALSPIVLLVRAMSRESWLRSLFSILSICMSILMIFLVGSLLWLISVRFHQTP